jgi:crotonobetainyl-CoA:carnitine CoA-transferase CaiB-like acyl-CoA transferase
MLAPYRVLDLSDRDGWMAGFLLAQLGADVVLVEPPGGHPRDSWFEAYNRGKRGSPDPGVGGLSGEGLVGVG